MLPDERQPTDEPRSEMAPPECSAVGDVSKVQSPCIEVCLLEDGVCQGCFRSIREIAAWSSATSELKRRILQECDLRRAMAGRA